MHCPDAHVFPHDFLSFNVGVWATHRLVPTCFRICSTRCSHQPNLETAYGQVSRIESRWAWATCRQLSCGKFLMLYSWAPRHGLCVACLLWSDGIGLLVCNETHVRWQRGASLKSGFWTSWTEKDVKTAMFHISWRTTVRVSVCVLPLVVFCWQDLTSGKVMSAFFCTLAEMRSLRAEMAYEYRWIQIWSRCLCRLSLGWITPDTAFRCADRGLHGWQHRPRIRWHQCRTGQFAPRGFEIYRTKSRKTTHVNHMSIMSWHQAPMTNVTM